MPAARWFLALLPLLAVACGGGGEPTKATRTATAAAARVARTPAPAGTPGPIPSPGHGGPRGARAVGFRALDGVGLRGRLFGRGDGPGVVLVHMGNNTSNEADWFGLARRLAREGYRVLAYNRRGVCSGDHAYDCSGGNDENWAENWQDVVGAVRFLGAERYAVMGSSIGASSMLYAAQTGQIRPAAMVTLAGVNYMAAYSFHQEDIASLPGAKLFVSAKKDPDDAARSAREWYGWARRPKRLALIDSDRHGTDMLAPAQPSHGPVTKLIVGFLRDALPPRK